MSSRRGPIDAPVALIVGASSGIGRSTARLLAARGARLVLVARGADRLRAVEEECRAAGALAVDVAVADVLDADAIQAVVDRVLVDHGRLDLVVHAAAVMAYGTVEDVPPEVFTRVVDVAIHGTANVARSILPALRHQQEGTFVIVTSLLASVPVPTIGAYITAKWGQLGLARVLQLEVRDEPDVHICTVGPGAVDTPIYLHAAKFGTDVPCPPAPVDRPEKVAEEIIRCLDRPRRNRSVGLVNHVVILGFRLVPQLYDALVAPLFRRTFSPGDGTTTEGNVFEPYHSDDEAVERSSHP